MNRLLQNINVAGTALFFQILAVGGAAGTGETWAYSLIVLAVCWSNTPHHTSPHHTASRPSRLNSTPHPHPPRATQRQQTDQRLAVPHISVPDLRYLDWDALAAAGFKAAVFDKDNTLCRPFALEVDAALAPALEAARRAFGGRLALYSNSAGLEQYDPDGSEAAALEAAFGVHCLRHREKKPAGGCRELEEHFGCARMGCVCRACEGLCGPSRRVTSCRRCFLLTVAPRRPLVTPNLLNPRTQTTHPKQNPKQKGAPRPTSCSSATAI